MQYTLIMDPTLWNFSKTLSPNTDTLGRLLSERMTLFQQYDDQVRLRKYHRSFINCLCSNCLISLKLRSLCFSNRAISLSSPSWPGFVILLPPPLKYWDYRCIPPCLASKYVLRIPISLKVLGVRALHVIKQD